MSFRACRSFKVRTDLLLADAEMAEQIAHYSPSKIQPLSITKNKKRDPPPKRNTQTT
jgi:hypothetical protein